MASALSPGVVALPEHRRAQLWEGSAARRGRQREAPSQHRASAPRTDGAWATPDEKSPTYAPPTYARVQPADLIAVGDE